MNDDEELRLLRRIDGLLFIDGDKLVVAAGRRMDPWASAAQVTAAQQPNNVVRTIMKSLEPVL